MEIVRAELTDAEILAKLNQHLIGDEGHPNPMNIYSALLRIAYFVGAISESRPI